MKQTAMFIPCSTCNADFLSRASWQLLTFFAQSTENIFLAFKISRSATLQITACQGCILRLNLIGFNNLNSII